MKTVHTEASRGWGGQELRILVESWGMIGRGHQVMLLCSAEARIFSEALRRGVPARWHYPSPASGQLACSPCAAGSRTTQ